MAIISFTAGDALQTLVVEAGVYLSEIVQIEGPKPAKSGNSNNFIVKVRITQDGKYKNKEKDLILNTNMRDSMDTEDGGRIYPTNLFLEMDAALQGKRAADAVDRPNFDTDQLLHKPIASVWAVNTVNGKLTNIITGFLPAGAEKAGPSF